MVRSCAVPYPCDLSTRASFDLHRRIALLQATPLFSGLDASDYARLAQASRLKKFKRGEIVFLQGESFRRLVVLDSGWVKLSLLRESGREVIVAMRGAQEVLDLSSGLSHTHSCTARAMTRTMVLTWPMPLVMQLMRERSKFGENAYRILGAEMRSLQNRYHEVTSEQVMQRLASTLMRLARQFGTTCPEGVVLHISREELAQITGTTLFTVSRMVSEWAKQGVVQSKREVILICNLVALKRMTSAVPADGAPPHA